MRTFLSRSRSLAVGLAVVAALLADAGAARAEADTFGLGTGRDGALSVTSAAGVVVNTYAPITAAIAAGASSVTVGPRVGAGATFVAGHRSRSASDHLASIVGHQRSFVAQRGDRAGLAPRRVPA